MELIQQLSHKNYIKLQIRIRNADTNKCVKQIQRYNVLSHTSM